MDHNHDYCAWTCARTREAVEPGVTGRMGEAMTGVLQVRHLRLVEAIHRLGTVTGAARQLHMTQPAASHALSKLEDRLGAKLFAREAAGMSITPEGRRVLDASVRILGELERAEYDVRQIASGTRGVLRLTTECYTTYQWLPEVIRRMRDEYPGVELRLHPEATYRVIEALRAGELDVALMSRPPSDEAYASFPILEDELVAVVRADHPWSGRPYVEAVDFATETALVHSDAEESTLFKRVLTPAGVRPSRVLELRLTEALVEVVRAGMGVAVLARWAVSRETSAGTLAAVRITADGLQRTWHAVVRRERAALPHVARLLQLLVDSALGNGPGANDSAAHTNPILATSPHRVLVGGKAPRTIRS
jgi:LysR family transcriptional regulator for metE and metH